MRTMNSAGRGGFTIIEAVVVAALAGVFAMGAFTLFNMYVGAQDETAARLRLQRQADGLMDEIGRLVRGAGYGGAGFVLGGKESAGGLFGGDDETLYDDGTSVADGRADTINIKDDNGVLASFRIFRINDTVGVVQMRDGGVGGAWNDFTVGGARVEVVLGVGGSVDKVSWFGLWSGRKQVSVNMVLRNAARSGKVFTMSARGVVFVCRN
jgi:type II secretory pathway pseudopilin PulG